MVEAAVQQALARLTETTAEKEDRRPALERDIREARQREQRLADAIAQGTASGVAPEALLNALRAEETRRKTLEQQLAVLPLAAAAIPLDRARLVRDLNTRAAGIRGLLRRRPEQARDALQVLLADRVECTPVLVAGTRGYAFTGDGTFGGLLSGNTWPTTNGGPIQGLVVNILAWVVSFFYGNLAFGLVALVGLVLSLVGLNRLGSGLRYSVGARIILVILILIPFINLITLAVLNSKATKVLRAARYHVGFMGASRGVGSG